MYNKGSPFFIYNQITTANIKHLSISGATKFKNVKNSGKREYKIILH